VTALRDLDAHPVAAFTGAGLPLLSAQKLAAIAGQQRSVPGPPNLARLGTSMDDASVSAGTRTPSRGATPKSHGHHHHRHHHRHRSSSADDTARGHHHQPPHSSSSSSSSGGGGGGGGGGRHSGHHHHAPSPGRHGSGHRHRSADDAAAARGGSSSFGGGEWAYGAPPGPPLRPAPPAPVVMTFAMPPRPADAEEPYVRTAGARKGAGWDGALAFLKRARSRRFPNSHEVRI